MDHASSNLAANVRRLRGARELTQRELADLAELPRPTLAHIETGLANPTLHVLLKVANALGATVEQLIEAPRAALRVVGCEDLRERSRGKARIRLLMPEPQPGVALERIELPAGARLRCEPSGQGTRLTLVCERGEVEVRAEGEVYALGAGDLVVAHGAVGHQLANPSRTTAVLYSIVTPAPPGG